MLDVGHLDFINKEVTPLGGITDLDVIVMWMFHGDYIRQLHVT